MHQSSTSRLYFFRLPTFNPSSCIFLSYTCNAHLILLILQASCLPAINSIFTYTQIAMASSSKRKRQHPFSSSNSNTSKFFHSSTAQAVGRGRPSARPQPSADRNHSETPSSSHSNARLSAARSRSIGLVSESFTPEDDRQVLAREESDELDQVIAALDVKERGIVGCAYYVAREERLYCMEDVKSDGAEVIETCK